MKTPLKHLATVALTLTALTWPSWKVNATEEEGEDIGARGAYRRLQLQDESGQISPDAWTNAYAEKEAMPFLPEAWSEFSSAEQIAAGMRGGRWTSIGPGNIGGRIRSLIIHPTTPATMWVGAVAGGVWKTTNGGDTWSTNTDFLANLAVNCMAIDPTEPRTLYAGTGEGFAVGDAVAGNGIFKTINGGDRWERLPSTANNPDFAYVNRLAISPNNSQLLLAAVRVEPTPPAYPYGKILRSTNGGTDWTTTLTSSTMTDVRFQPNNLEPDIPDIPAINCMASSIDGHVFYSTNGGANWTTRADNLGLPAPGSFRRVELAYSRSNPLIVYASSALDSRLYKSINGGFGFAFTASNPCPNGDCVTSYTNALWVDPINSDTVIVGGKYMQRTTDGGTTWAVVNQGHADHHAIIEHPSYNRGDNQIVYDCSDGGIFRTNYVLGDPLQSWTSRNNTLGITQFYGAAGNASTGTIIGGTQDNSTLRFRPADGSENWRRIADGDGGFCAADQTDPNYFYFEDRFLTILRSTNGGEPFMFQSIWGGPNHPNGIPGACGGIPCANFTAPFVIDPNPNQENTLLAGGKSLWRTTNAKSESNPLLVRWDEIKQPAGGEGNYINAIAVAEGDSDLIWVGYNDGSVYYTTNGTRPGPSPSPTPTWSPGDPNNLLPGGQPQIDERFCTRITIGQAPQTNDPQVARTVYVTFGGFFPSLMDTRGNVWKRDINGNWSDIHHNLPSTPIFSLVISPSNPAFLYVGTEVGVFASADGGATWSPAFGGSSSDFIFSLVSSAAASEPDIVYVGTEDGVFASKDEGATWTPGFGGPANTRVAELFWMINGPNRKLVVATHGRGMFTLAAGN